MLGQEKKKVQLVYETSGDEECPNEQAFKDIVGARLGYDPFSEEALEMIHATLKSVDQGYVGNVQAYDAEGSPGGLRTIDAGEQSCREVAVSMAVAISILLDPFGQSQTGLIEAEEVIEVPKASDKPPPRKQKPEPQARNIPDTKETSSESPVDFGFVFSIGFSGSYPILPGVSVGPKLNAGIKFNNISILAAGRVDFMPSPQDYPRFGGGKDVLDATLFSVGPAGCYDFGLGFVCLSLQFGVLQGRALNVTNPRTQSTFWASTEISAGVTIPVGDVFFTRVSAELYLPLIETSFQIDRDPIWRSEPVAGGISVALGADFSRQKKK